MVGSTKRFQPTKGCDSYSSGGMHQQRKSWFSPNLSGVKNSCLQQSKATVPREQDKTSLLAPITNFQPSAKTTRGQKSKAFH